MSPSTAFTNAAGGSISAIALVTTGTICAAVLLWAGWATLSIYMGWARERVEMPVFQRALIRVAALTLLILWIVLQ